MDNQYYVVNLDLMKLNLSSLIGEVRTFEVYRKVVMNRTIVEARNNNYEIDMHNSVDGAVRVIIYGKITGKVESIIAEERPGQIVINLSSHTKPISLIVVR